jgi:hypothetical protein
MGKRLRRLRGVMGIGATWGILWAILGAALSIVVGIIDPDSIDAGEGPVRVGAILGGIGLVSGTLFGAFLVLAESGRAILDLSLVRTSMWGILGSAAVPLLTGRQDQVFVMCPVGAVVAMASVAITRRWERRRPERPRRARDFLLLPIRASISDAVDSVERTSA